MKTEWSIKWKEGITGYELKNGQNFEKALIAAVNHSGDSDSTGSVTGNIVGTYLGYGKIPRKFLDRLELKDVILSVADDLYNDCQMTEYGGLLCAYGCVACGACVEACRFGAVQINDLGCAEVDEEKCIGCGACARKCPRGLIDLRRTEDRIAVLCSNRDKGFDPATKTGARTVCDVSCIGCGLCVKKCPADAIHVVEFRAVIDYERCLSCGACGDVCPRHAIRDRFGIITEKC